MVKLSLAVSEKDEEPEEWDRNRAVEGGEDSEVKVLYALGKKAVKSPQLREICISNGTTEHKSPKSKPDLEIPRKMLHASIGPFSSSILITYLTEFSIKASLLYTFIYRRAMCTLLFLCYGWHWLSLYQLTSPCPSLSWADTATSTIGHLFGSYTAKLPSRVPLL